MWAKKDTIGSNTKFEGIICTPSLWTSGAAADPTLTFTGDTDGSDNWDYICSIDPEGTANAAVNYPAFDWVNKYNTTYAAQLGNALPSWYMPSIAELSQIYKNKDVINASLAKISGLNSAYAVAKLETGSLWSSSQYGNDDPNAHRAVWYMSASDGMFQGKLREYKGSVCCIAAF